MPIPTENTGYAIPSCRHSAVRSETTQAIVIHPRSVDNLGSSSGRTSAVRKQNLAVPGARDLG